MDKAKILKEIEKEIDWYQVPKHIANAMRKLGRLGFRPGGHGVGCGGEDWSLFYDLSKKKDSYIYVNLSYPVKDCSISVYLNDTDEPGFTITKSIPKTLELARKLKRKYNS